MNKETSFIVGFVTGAASVLALLFLMRSVQFVPQSAPQVSHSEAADKTAPALQAGFTETDPGDPVLGTMNAPVTIREYADFHCVHCARVSSDLKRLVMAYPGSLRLVYHHFPLSDVPGQGSFFTHQAGVCAQAQGKFWPFYDAVYSKGPGIDPSSVREIAQKTGLDMTQFESCLSSPETVDFLRKKIEQARAAGVQATPSFKINNHFIRGARSYEFFENYVKAVLDPSIPLPTEQPARPSPPSRIEIDTEALKDRPVLGPADAPVTLLEFSDFHCPYCKKANGTIEQLLDRNKDKIKRIWLHFPLPMHEGAFDTHIASECAFVQGKFWEYHDGLMKTDKIPASRSDLLETARPLGLDMKKFEECLDSQKARDAVAADRERAKDLGVISTPTFVINGQVVRGNVPIAVFESAVSQALSQEPPDA